MRLGQLRDFIAIVEAGSIRSAARRRGVSQPVLTKSLRLLEGDVGVRLLHRTAKGILLTASGRVLLARAKAVQTQLAKAREELSAIAGHGEGTVAFGASASGLVLVPEALTRFQAQYPRYYVRIVEGAPTALLPLLRDESIDFFFGPKPVARLDPQVLAKPLFRLPLAIAARRGHPLRQSRSLEDLAGCTWLLLSAGGWTDSMLAQSFKAAGVKQPARLVQCESYSSAVALLSQTDTLGLLPRRHLLEPALASVVDEIPVRNRLPELTFAMYVRAGDTSTNAASTFMKLVSAVSREMMERYTRVARLGGG
jgi:LysR family transcriptional regulator of abg operon